MAWFSRERSGAEGAGEGEKRVRTEGLWLKCEGCSQIIWKKALEENVQVCPQCDHHFRLDARTRLALLFDDGAYEEVRRQPDFHRSAAFRRFQNLRGALERDAEEHLDVGRAAGGLRQASRAPREHLRDGAEVHRRQHGRGGGREDHARRGAVHGTTRAVDRGFGVGRRAHAGGRDQPDADGQNFGGADAFGRGTPALTSAC